jgi:hypothetical protein
MFVHYVSYQISLHLQQIFVSESDLDAFIAFVFQAVIPISLIWVRSVAPN